MGPMQRAQLDLTLPLDLQLACIDAVWSPIDDKGVWAGRKLRDSLRLVCKAWHKFIDGQAEVFAIITSTPQIRQMLDNKAEALARMRYLCISFCSCDVGFGEADNVVERLMRLNAMMEAAAHLLLAVSGTLQHLAVRAYSYANVRAKDRMFKHALGQLTALRSLAHLPNPDYADHWPDLGCDELQYCAIEDIFENCPDLARLDCHSMDTELGDIVDLRSIPAALTELHVLQSPNQWNSLARLTAHLPSLNVIVCGDEGGLVATAGIERIGHLKSLGVCTPGSHHLADLPNLPKLRYLYIQDGGWDEWRWDHFAKQELDVLEYRHCCSLATDVDQIEHPYADYIVTVVDELIAMYEREDGPAPLFGEFHWRCQRGCTQLQPHEDKLRRFFAGHGIVFTKTWGYDLGWANV